MSVSDKNPQSSGPAPPGGVRQVRLRTSGATMQRLPGGVLSITPNESLHHYPKVLTDKIQHWSISRPDKTCIAKRGDDQWRRLTYAQVWDSIRSIGQALLDRKLSAER